LDSAVVAIASVAVRGSAAIDRVWPGFWNPPGFAIFRPDTAIYLFTTDSAPSDFKRVNDPRLPEPIRRSWYVLEKSSRGFRGGAIPIDPNARRLVMAVGLPEPPLSSLEFLLHESFHGWQFRNFANLFDLTIPQRLPDTLPLPPHFHTQVQEERRLLLLALEATLTANIRARVHDYLAAREQRFSESPALAVRIERSAERREGTAEFVGLAGELAASGFVADVLSDSIRARIRSDTHWGAANLPPRERLSSRAYRTGSAMAFLLDRLACQNWRARVAEGASLDVQLAECIGLLLKGARAPANEELKPTATPSSLVE
jgi:hypothetical protein